MVLRGSAEQIIGASLRHSPLWDLRVHRLTTNMRVQRLTGTAAAEQRCFSQWLLYLGSGMLEQEPELVIRVPDNMAMYSGAPSRRSDPCAPGMHVHLHAQNERVAQPDRCR